MKLQRILPAVIAALAITAPFGAFAADKKKADAPAAPAATKPAAAEEKAVGAVKALPYQAKVASVDAAAKTFTTKNKDGKENVFSVTDKTTIEKADGSAGTLADIKADEVVRGTRIKQGEGKWEATKVIIGAKDKKADATSAKPSDVKPADKK